MAQLGSDRGGARRRKRTVQPAGFGIVVARGAAPDSAREVLSVPRSYVNWAREPEAGCQILQLRRLQESEKRELQPNQE